MARGEDDLLPDSQTTSGLPVVSSQATRSFLPRRVGRSNSSFIPPRYIGSLALVAFSARPAALSPDDRLRAGDEDGTIGDGR